LFIVPCTVGAGQRFIVGFAICIENLTLIRFPLYVTDKKTGKLQLIISYIISLLRASL
jgi:hypothetical protein